MISSAFGKRITDREIRFALVGCGRIARNHFSAIKHHGDSCRLVGICDIESEALERAAELTGATPYRSLDTMLADCKADAVILTTPSGLHPCQAIKVAQSGRHVITEKPMATRWDDGKRMVTACDDAHVRLFVVKQNRRNATLRYLKQAIEKKRFGRIHMVNLNVFWTRPQEYYDSAVWRGTWEYDGGAFMNQASHYVDLLNWLIGPVESLQAYTATLERDIEVEDTGVMSLRWRNGALGSVNVTMLAYQKNFEGSITVLGERGTVRIGGVALNQIDHWEFADASEAEENERVKESSYATDSVYGFGHIQYYENVIRVLRGEVEPETDGREGLKTLEILIATYLSARDGKRVALPLEY
ncbi:Gfo/Idh/MocA family protein [Noviherbaspirillum sp. UKPF54]|uniref:Gfo/Idh/MocA family protein n=1 Tax=Noviherbaspirillum sp. UKPF54 TaxID=2601898 RepID=UPI0011B115E9|nr:Gfo/Idh/MocA family oxidoreductase [Noviherbaspirillum sp. UKPF54]QDZ28629.1 Gfo/Idh/MocA family oxidoreductase [Noviherbaspirillum sp. UKPF54]